MDVLVEELDVGLVGAGLQHCRVELPGMVHVELQGLELDSVGVVMEQEVSWENVLPVE